MPPIIYHRNKGLSGPFFQPIGGGFLMKGSGNAFGPGGANAGATPAHVYFDYDPATFELSPALPSGRQAVINVPGDDGFYYQVAGTKVAYVGARHADGKQYADNGSGVLLDPQPYALSAPAATNLVKDCRNCSTANWTIVSGASAVRNAVGIDGVASAASTMTTDVTGYNSRLRQTVACTPGARVSAIFYMPVLVSQDHYAGIMLYSAPDYSQYHLNQVTGEIWLSKESGPVNSEGTSIRDGEYWRVVMTYTPPGATTRLDLLAYATTTWQGLDAVNGGIKSSVFDAFQVYDNMSHAVAVGLPPIYTAGAAATRDKDVIAAVLGDINQPSNSGFLEVNIAAGSTPNILGTFLSYNGTAYVLTDGTNSVSVIAAAGEQQIGWYAGTMGMNLRVGDVWGTEQPYDGTVAGLGVYTNAPYPQEIRNWHLWDAANQALVDNAFLEINLV